MNHNPLNGMSDAQAAEEAERLIKLACQPEPEPELTETRYRDTTPLPRYGTTPPVRQEDRRIVPELAVGIAVSSIAVGAGTVLVGCGAWLVLKGLASVTLTGVLFVTLPFAAIAMAITAAGVTFSRLREKPNQHIYQGPVTQNTEVKNTTRGWLFVRARNHVR